MKKIMLSGVLVFSCAICLADALWEEFKTFAEGRTELRASAGGMLDKELQRKKYFADTFAGKQTTLAATYKSSGKGVMGGTYVDADVDGIAVKIMVRPSEKAKIGGLSLGDAFNFTAVYKSRGDALHSVTFEDGVIGIGDEAPAAGEETAVDVTQDSALWQEYRDFAAGRMDRSESGFRAAAKKEMARKKYFSDHFYGKKVMLSGTFSSTGKAVMGGQYVSVKVDDVNVKIMIRPSEVSKAKGLRPGSRIRFTGNFKSRGDAMHGVTLEDGVIVE